MSSLLISDLQEITRDRLIEELVNALVSWLYYVLVHVQAKSVRTTLK